MRILPIAIVASLVATAAATAAGPGQIMPGMWENTSTVTAIDMPGMPANVVAMMKQPHTVRHCVTPEEAARGPAEAMKGDKSCQVKNFTMTGGIYKVDLVCPQVTMHSEGHYTPTSYQATGNMVAARGMKMSFAGSGRLIGPCK